MYTPLPTSPPSPFRIPTSHFPIPPLPQSALPSSPLEPLPRGSRKSSKRPVFLHTPPPPPPHRATSRTAPKSPVSLSSLTQANGGGTCREYRRIPLQLKSCKTEALSHRFATMATLVIKSFPEALHAKLRQFAAAHRRSVTQETIHLIETAIAAEEQSSPTTSGQSKWANRKLLPEYEAMIATGAFSGGTDSTQIISEERDAR